MNAVTHRIVRPDIGEVLRQNRALAERLLSLTVDVPLPSPEPPPPETPENADAIVAHIEINDHHGVGVLLGRLFGHSGNVVSIRSKNFYEGRQDFGAMHVCLSHGNATRDSVFWNVLQSLGCGTIGRVLCVPYFPDDALTAIALKEAYGAPLCTFLMDDQNLHADGIPDSLMSELLAKSALRLAISPQMCAGYEAKYRHKMFFMPPLAPSRLIPTQLNRLGDDELRQRQPLILGNIWGQQWVELLRRTVRGSGIQIRWFNNGQFPWLSCTIEDLARDGILAQQGSPEPDDTFVETLRQAPFVVIPSGTLTEDDDRRFIAQLSFPSRIPYIMATSHTPILILGSPETAAAQVVTRLGIGMVTPYDQEHFQRAVERMASPDVNLAMRRAAFAASERFTDAGADEWIWQSLARCEPVDSRYEDLLIEWGTSRAG